MCWFGEKELFLWLSKSAKRKAVSEIVKEGSIPSTAAK